MGPLVTDTSQLFSRKMMSIERLTLQRATILVSKVVREWACVCIGSGKGGPRQTRFSFANSYTRHIGNHDRCPFQ